MTTVCFCFFSVLLFLFLFTMLFNICKETNRTIVLAAVCVVINYAVIATFLCAVYYLYSLLNILLVAIFECLILAIIITKKHSWVTLRNIINIKFSFFGVISILFICYLYLKYPTEYFDGGRDPGGYYTGAIRIADTGGWQIPFDEESEEVFLKYESFLKAGYPGIYSARKYGKGAHQSDLIPQFLPAFPAILAIGYDLGSFFIVNRVNGVLAILGLALLYYYIYDVMNSKMGAKIAVVLLSISPAYLWNARETVTEIMTFMMLLAAIYIDSRYGKKTKAIVFTSFLLGFLGYVRIDSYILGIAFGLKEIYMVSGAIKKEEKRKVCIGYLTYIIVFFSSLIYTRQYSYPYFVDHYYVLKYIILLNIVLFISFIMIIIISKKSNVIYILKKEFDNLLYQRVVIYFIGATLYVAFRYAYLYRPNQIDSGFNERAMVEFCWYTSPIIIIFTILGICFSIYKNKKLYSQLLFILSGMLCLVIYIYNPTISSDHMWASRRWISAAIPFVFVMGAYGLSIIDDYIKIKKVKISILLCIPIIVYLINQDMPFINHSMMEDLHIQYDNLAQRLKDDIIYFTDDGYIAGILCLTYHKQVYLVDRKEMEKYVKENNEPLYFIGEDINSDITYECQEYNTIQYESLERTIGYYPRNILEYKHIANIYYVYL